MLQLIDPARLSIFIAAALALLLVPGPAVIYIVTRSVSQGRWAGLASVMGIETASLLHVAAAALGLTAILVSSTLAFSLVKLAGAIYLIFLGVRQLLRGDGTSQRLEAPLQPLWQIYRQGVVVNLLNPKTALFFFAFLPQFVDLKRGNVPVQFLFLGILFVSMATCTDGAYSLASSLIADRLKGSRFFLGAERFLTAAVYIGLGISTLVL